MIFLLVDFSEFPPAAFKVAAVLMMESLRRQSRSDLARSMLGVVDNVNVDLAIVIRIVVALRHHRLR
jgi:hypothetical protein